MAKRDYKKIYKKYHSSRKAKKARAARNKARRQMVKAGRVRKGDGKEVDHKRPLSKGGSNGKKNLRVVKRKKNRNPFSFNLGKEEDMNKFLFKVKNNKL